MTPTLFFMERPLVKVFFSFVLENNHDSCHMRLLGSTWWGENLLEMRRKIDYNIFKFNTVISRKSWNTPHFWNRGVPGENTRFCCSSRGYFFNTSPFLSIMVSFVQINFNNDPHLVLYGKTISYGSLYFYFGNQSPFMSYATFRWYLMRWNPLGNEAFSPLSPYPPEVK